ncbi:MAG TPA: D-alanyl-D-alanine carboxypeptidase [Thermopetrobacter sp.]|nr:D-alanyl-D-alanine carboxypeptidase [Thermopetrobacter sp.]
MMCSMMRMLTGVLLMWLGWLWPAAAALPAEFQSKAKYAILLDARSGTVFFEKYADVPMPPASMTKIMTMILVFEKLKKGELSEDATFEVSVDAWKRGGAPSGGSTMFARPREVIPLNTLMRAVVIVSANDAAIAIAEGIAGSEAAFAQMMNARARRLGLVKSHFVNATGLPHPKHRMTARELAALTRYLIAVFPEYYKLYRERGFTWNNIRQGNRNPLLGRYAGADGVKTGYTKEAGYGLVASAVRDGRRLIAVISGLKSKRERAAEAKRILDWGFARFKAVKLYGKGAQVTQARIWGGATSLVPLVARDDIVVRLSDKERKRARASVHYTGPLMAPVAAGQAVAELRIFVEERLIARYPLVTGQSVAEDTDMWHRALDTIKVWMLGG